MVEASPAVAFRGGRIVTMDRAHPSAEVVVVAHDRIVAVGDAALLDAWPHASVVALGSRTLLPGFIDAHNHLSLAALQPRWADLAEADTVDAVLAALALQAEREPHAEWVRGARWELTVPVALTRHDLDRLGLDRPVIVAHYSVHQAVVSSLGLQRLGIDAATPHPQGGRIGRGEDGSPTGLLLERAWSAAHAASLRNYGDPDRWGALVLARMRELLAEGVTCVHDPACPPDVEAVYAQLASRGALPVSVVAMPHPPELLGRLDRRRLAGAPTGAGDEVLRVGPVKLFADGGAAPAIRATRGGREYEAGLRFAGLEEDAVAAARAGFGVAVHAMGNAGLDAALDAFAAVRRALPDDDVALRVEHATLASRSQIERLAALDVAAVVQPGFVDVMGPVAARLPFDDATWLPFADLAGAGVRLAASSDDPCGAWAPTTVSASGTIRRLADGTPVGPDQTLPYLAWLQAWTAGAAAVGGQSGERGSLTPGKRADLVVLEGELDAAHPPRVVETWVAGRCEYRRDPA